MEKLTLPKYAQRYEYVKFLPDDPFVENVTANSKQAQKNNIRYQINDRTGIYDWYNAYFECNFFLTKLSTIADAVGVGVAPICGSSSLIRRIVVFSQEGDNVYECSEVNKAVFCKKLLSQSRDYAETIAQDEMWYLDTARAIGALAKSSAEGDPQPIDTLNAINTRAGLFSGKQVQNVRIPFKNWSFFESMDFNNIMLSGMQMSILVDLEDETRLIVGADARLIVKNLNLWVPLVSLHPQYVDNYVRNITKGSMLEWSYRRERVFRHAGEKSETGVFRIPNITSPKKVIYYFVNYTSETSTTQNMQHFNSIFNEDAGEKYGIGHNPADGTNGANLKSARVEIGSDNVFYPRNDYKSSELGRLYHDVTKYAHVDDNDMGLQMTRNLYRDQYSMIYIDLDYKKHGVIQDNTDVVLHYDLSKAPHSEFYIFCVIEYMNEAKFGQRDGSFVITSTNVTK